MNDEKFNEEDLNKMDDVSEETNKFLDEMVEAPEDEFQESDEEDHEDDSLMEPDKPEEEKQDDHDEERERKERNRKNAERRLRNKKLKEDQQEEDNDEEEDDEPHGLSDDELDAESARVYRERLDAAEQYIADTQDIIQTVQETGLNKEQLQVGAQFVKKWSSDPIGTAKELLTFLEKRGIDISQIYDHQVDNRQTMIDEEVNRRMQPMLQQQREAQIQQQARETLDNFLGQYPDAEMHLGEIVEVMRRANLRNPYDAYDRLRRVYRNRNVDWFGREPQEPVPPMNSRQRLDTPMEPEPRSIDDLIRTNARKYFNGEL